MSVSSVNERKGTCARTIPVLAGQASTCAQRYNADVRALHRLDFPTRNDLRDGCVRVRRIPLKRW